MEWIKLTTRPTTDEEKNEGIIADIIYTGATPDVNEFVLVSNGDWVDFDYWADFEDGTVGFEKYYAEEYDLWWMSLPKAPKRGED